MPFEPRIAGQPDDERRSDEPAWDDAAELELPDDLTVLAEQLRDDAMYLAKCHPADATPDEREAAMRESAPAKPQAARGWWLRRAAAAAAILIVASSGWLLWKNIKPDNTQPPTIANNDTHITTPPPIAAAPPLIARENIDEDTNNNTADELPTAGPRLIPAAFLREVSGPELDGMLDLIGQDEAGLSI